MRLFISYAHEDIEKVERLVQVLRDGGHDPWFDTQLNTGVEWRSKLEAEIQLSDAFIYALSPNSVDSEWCQWEFVTAIKSGKPIIPILLKGTSLPVVLSQYHYFDLTGGFRGRKKEKLLKELNKLAVTIPKEQAPDAPNVDTSELEIHPFTHRPLLKQLRKFETAAPACTKLNHESQLKVKLSLLDSLGLRAELPELLPSGDIIQKEDVRTFRVPLTFPLNKDTDQLEPSSVCLEIITDQFDVVAVSAESGDCATDQYHLTVPVTRDSGTLNFRLRPIDKQRPGPTTIYVKLYQDGRNIAEADTVTQLVESMEDNPMCGDWRLQVTRLNLSQESELTSPLLDILQNILSNSAFQGALALVATVMAAIGLAYGDGLINKVNVIDSTPTATATLTDTPTATVTLKDTPPATITLIPTPIPTTPSTIIPNTPELTITPSKSTLTIYHDKDSLTLYVPQGATGPLEGITFVLQDGTPYEIAQVDDFGFYLSGSMSPPFCLRWMISASNPALPGVCREIDHADNQIPPGDAFWWNLNTSNTRTFLIRLNDQTLGVCNAGGNTCNFKISD